MTIKVIVELHAKPGKQAELKSLLESVEAKFASRQAGFLGSTYHKVLHNPNVLVEIADWSSAEVWAAAMQEVMASSAYRHLEELSAAPFGATVIKPLS